MHAFAGHLGCRRSVTNRVIEDFLRLLACGSGCVTNDLAGIARRIANNLAGLFGAALCFVRGSSRSLAQIRFIGQASSLGEQMLSTVGDGLLAATGGVAGNTRPIVADSFATRV